MARFDYSSYLKREETKNTGDYKVSFFGLKDDGDEATVRFVYNSINEFHLATVHALEIDGKPRRVSCLRTGHEPLSKCPLCDSGNRVYDKMYVKLIQYTTEADEKVSIQACVWERPAYFSKTLESLFKEYGILSDTIFKIKRQGKKGDKQTTYGIFFANPAVYKSEIYVKDFSAFDDFEINTFFYTEKTADEMRVFLATGKFPEKAKTPTDNIASPVPTKSVVTQPQTEIPVQPSTTVAQPDTIQPQTGISVQPSTTSDDPTAQRPRRYTY